MTDPRPSEPTIDELKAIQRAHDLVDVHLCYVGSARFVLAHADDERARINLEDCELHAWLSDLSGPEGSGLLRGRASRGRCL